MKKIRAKKAYNWESDEVIVGMRIHLLDQYFLELISKEEMQKIGQAN